MDGHQRVAGRIRGSQDRIRAAEFRRVEVREARGGCDGERQFLSVGPHPINLRRRPVIVGRAGEEFGGVGELGLRVIPDG